MELLNLLQVSQVPMGDMQISDWSPGLIPSAIFCQRKSEALAQACMQEWSVYCSWFVLSLWYRQSQGVGFPHLSPPLPFAGPDTSIYKDGRQAKLIAIMQHHP